MEWYRAGKAPIVLGHEVTGDVVETGKGVSSIKKGDRVAVSHHVPCDNCLYCLQGHQTVCETMRKTNFDPGGFSEYIRLPAINVEKGIFKLPEDVSYDEGSFVEPLACVIRGQRIANIKKGKSLLVLGCGIAGLLHIKLAKFYGIKKIFASDIIDFRIKKAEKSGADIVFKSGDDFRDIIRKNNNGMLVDRVIVCTGAERAIIDGISSLERGGVLLFFATPKPETRIALPVNTLFWRTEITLTSSYAGSPDEYAEALKIISEKKITVDDLITHRLPLYEISMGFKLVENGRESIKVIIDPTI